MSAPAQDSQEEELTIPFDGGCFGCSPANPDGLKMRFRRRGDTILARFTVADRFHGAPGIVHGGIVATMMDEVSCVAAVFVRDRRVVTGELTVRYRRPCPIEQPLELEARVTGEHPRYFIIEADLRRDGEVLAHSTGKFFFARDAGPSAP